MRQPGVEVRGITQPDGTAEFCEVFFDDARCPKDNVVGGVNNGWKVANSTLGFERGQSATTGYRRFEEEYRQMVAAATENGAIEDPHIRQRLAQYYTKYQILRINGLRSLSATLSGSKDLGVVALGAMNKMFWSEMHQRAMELALDIYGAQSMLVDAGPASGSWPGALRDKRREGYPVSPMMSSFFFSRSETIWGGTSQIQRNIVGERVLGLPKEPQVAAADVAHSECLPASGVRSLRRAACTKHSRWRPKHSDGRRRRFTQLETHVAYSRRRMTEHDDGQPLGRAARRATVSARPAAAEVLALVDRLGRRGAAGPAGRGGDRHPHDGHHVHRLLRRLQHRPGLAVRRHPPGHRGRRSGRAIERGLVQRLQALNHFIDDVYNDRRVVADGVFPADLLDDSVNYRPECQGVHPKFGVWAHISRLRPRPRRRRHDVRAGGQPARAVRASAT